MTINNEDSMSVEDISSLADQARAHLAYLERTRDEQPGRLAKARSDADEAWGWALLEEPWDEQWSAVPGFNADGDMTAMLALPNITAKELWGARLAFDLLDCGEDFDRIDEVLSRLFTTVHGDPGMAMLVMSAALSTIAGTIVPQLLEEIEHSGSNYAPRVMLAEARAKAWAGRVSEIRDRPEAAT